MKISSPKQAVRFGTHANPTFSQKEPPATISVYIAYLSCFSTITRYLKSILAFWRHIWRRLDYPMCLSLESTNQPTERTIAKIEVNTMSDTKHSRLSVSIPKLTSMLMVLFAMIVHFRQWFGTLKRNPIFTLLDIQAHVWERFYF